MVVQIPSVSAGSQVVTATDKHRQVYKILLCFDYSDT